MNIHNPQKSMTTDIMTTSTTTGTWWHGATIYQIYPRSFADSNGDGIGDLPGITAKLDHVASLGVDAIWLSPFFTSPMVDFGYDVADYCDVDPIFGTLADFDIMLAKAHSLGIKVIIDQVYAHSSDQHDWFKASREDKINAHADWYVWADAKPDGTPPNNWASVFYGAAWTWDAQRGQYYMHNFLPEQPQLNMHNPAVQDALLAATRFWLDRGVDGFRLDALNFGFHNPALTNNPPETDPKIKRTRPHDFQQKIHNMSQPELLPFVERVRALTDEYGARFTVAEVGGADAEPEMQQLTMGQKRLNTAYSFSFLHNDPLTPAGVADIVTRWDNDPETGWPSWAFSNHDAMRTVSRWTKGRDEAKFAKLAMMLLLSLRGNPFIYQGEELGLCQADVPFERLVDPEAIKNWPLTMSRDGARTPMPWGDVPEVEPWLPLDPRHHAQSAAVQEQDAASPLAFTRHMIAVRRGSAALRLGTITMIETSADVLAFERQSDAETMLCVFNLGEAATSYVPNGKWDAVIALEGASPEDATLPLLGGYVARRS